MARRPSATRRAASPPAYSIRLAAETSGVPEETLRAWERRHGWPRPERTSGGARLYSADDIARLRRVRGAIERGFRPGVLLGGSEEEIDAMLAASEGPAPPAIEAPTLDALLAAVAAEDALAVQSLLRGALLLGGPRRFLVEIARPASVRVGELWATGELEVRHEHLLTAALAAQLSVALASFEWPRAASAVLLTTLPGATHTLGLDMVALYLASSGVAPLRLGPETPVDQIVAAARAPRVRAVGLAVTPPHDVAETRAGVAAIARGLRRVRGDDAPELWVGGAGAEDVRGATRALEVIPDWPTLDRRIEALAP